MPSVQHGFLRSEENVVLNNIVLSNIVLNNIINPRMAQELAVVIGSRMLAELCYMLAERITKFSAADVGALCSTVLLSAMRVTDEMPLEARMKYSWMKRGSSAGGLMVV